MSKSVNKVFLLGHLGKDAEVKFTPSGIQVAQFSVATSFSYKPANATEYVEKTEWHRCKLWRCENLAKFLTKGKQVHIEGRLETRSWEKDGVTHYQTEIIVDEIALLGVGSDRSGSTPGAAAKPSQGSQAGAARGGRVPSTDPNGISDDDVPF